MNRIDIFETWINHLDARRTIPTRFWKPCRNLNLFVNQLLNNRTQVYSKKYQIQKSELLRFAFLVFVNFRSEKVINSISNAPTYPLSWFLNRIHVSNPNLLSHDCHQYWQASCRQFFDGNQVCRRS